MQCSHFDTGKCHSCNRLSTPYAEQIQDKSDHLRSLLGHYTQASWLPFQTSSESRFRNKAKMVALGYAHAPILGIVSPQGEPESLTDCPLYSPEMNELLGALPELIRKEGVPPYQISKQRGELKHVLVTESRANQQFLLRFVLRSHDALDRIKRLSEKIQQAFPAVRVVSVNIQPAHSAILEGEEEIFLTEAQEIIEVFNGIPLAIRPKSFFQTHTELAEILYATAAEWVKSSGAKRIWDLFCGVGGFGLHCLSESVELTGIEIEPEAINAARKSAKALGLSEHVRFEAFDATALQSDAIQRPDLIIVNPPRRGIGSQLCRLLDDSGTPELIYSSCNPISLTRDLEELSNYTIKTVQGFDLFPHTDHYEVLVHLHRLP